MVVPRGSARSIPRARAHRSEHGDGNPIQNNISDIPGGGARGKSGSDHNSQIAVRLQLS
jgi:hypothetical protein